MKRTGVTKTMRSPALCLLVGAFALPVMADNCTGELNFRTIGGGPGESTAGKVSTWIGAMTFTSEDSPYGGQGTCTGHVYEGPDGKTMFQDVCVRTAADGSAVGTVAVRELPNPRGKWTATYGTGRFSKAEGSSGWYEIVSIDDKGNGSGKWGGNCN